MVTDTLENAHLYERLHERFKLAFNYLRQPNITDLEKGKYEIDGENIFSIVNVYETKDKDMCEVEAHKKYIDIQYIISGVEMFGYAPLTIQKAVIDYNETDDVAIYEEEVSYVKLEAGMFIIFYPSDLHQPEVRQFEPVTVKKIVIKIKI